MLRISILFSVFGYTDETLPLVFDILLEIRSQLKTSYCRIKCEIVFSLFVVGCSTILSLVSSGLPRLSDKFSCAGR